MKQQRARVMGAPPSWNRRRSCSRRPSAWIVGFVKPFVRMSAALEGRQSWSERARPFVRILVEVLFDLRADTRRNIHKRGRATSYRHEESYQPVRNVFPPGVTF